LFTEKNLPRLIIATPIVLVLLFAMFIIYTFVNSQYENFDKESKELEIEYLKRQKEILINENQRVLDYIKFHRDLEAKKIHNHFRNIRKSGKEVSEKEVEEYEKKSYDRLKKEVIDWVESVRYGKNGYVWIHDTSHHLIAHPFRPYDIGKDDTNNTDATGDKIFQKFINTATRNPEGGFVEYYWAKPEFEAPRKKIGFLKLDKTWGWVVGTGLYIDDIESSIFKKKLQLERKIDKYVQIILLSAFSLILLFGIIGYMISKRIVEVFTSYRQNVIKKEQALKEFNKTLSHKIDEALNEAKKKDRALLHQSRLAQMGEMLSMIAHQWRQPLCEISGIFMEMETASKFKKADNEFIAKNAKDGYNLISYMSKTIDDFRDFFKPAKTKEEFSLIKACKEAIVIAEASLKSKDIKLLLHVKDDVKVFGYSSEFAQVILNLILNARDILVERGIKDAKIDISILKKEKEIILSVSDNGGGIEEGIINRVFEPYFSTKKSSGTGLGLYMSKMIIEENMGGKLSVKNGNDGAVFEVILHV
jgi:signal transduction histidine kinase